MRVSFTDALDDSTEVDTATDTSGDTSADTGEDTGEIDGPLLGELALSDADATFTGEYATSGEGAAAGMAVAAVGDADGDEIDDLIIAATVADAKETETGRIYVIPGPIGAGVHSLGDAPVSIGLFTRGTSELSIVLAGDRDHDGLSALAVLNNYDSTLYMFEPLLPGTYDAADAARTVTQVSPSPGGRGLASGGDVDGGGPPDLLVSNTSYSDGYGAWVGRVWMLGGAVFEDGAIHDVSATIFHGERGDWSEPPELGQFVGWDTAMGDVNGDGEDDAIIGAPGPGPDDEPGQVAIWQGPLNLGRFAVSDADILVIGEDDDHGIGTDVAGVGDIDGDGYDDLAASSDATFRGQAGAGRIYVLRGPVMHGAAEDAFATFDGVREGDAAGALPASRFDANGDGIGDLLVGAGNSGEGGAAWLVYGPVSAGAHSLSDAAAIFSGAEGDAAGTALDAGGDLNADGIDDLVIGAPGNADAGAGAGKVSVFFGGG